MSSVKINDIEYAECNYPNYFWFWTWPFHWNRDNFASAEAVNKPYFYATGAGSVENFDVGKWEQFVRCPCGVGYTPSKRVAAREGKTQSPTKPDNRWLCNVCGRDTSTLVMWIGRRVSNRWEWKPESELPVDLRPKKKEEKNSEEEFEKRVKAAVEVELSLRAQAPQSEIILG
jgi:hypothetical protein